MPTLSELIPDLSLLMPDFDGYKLSLDKVPTYTHQVSFGVQHREPSSEQFSFAFVRLFALHNHLHGDPYTKDHVYFISDSGQVVQNRWDSDRRAFETNVVASESSSSPENGVLNPSLCLDAPNHAALMTGDAQGLLSAFSTGERATNEEWKQVASLKLGSAGVIRCLSFDQEKHELQILAESIVLKGSVPELKLLKEGEAGTLIHWLKINPDLGKGDDCLLFHKKICVPGVVEYVAFEEGGQAIYVCSEKEPVYAFDSVRPCTPPIERAFRDPFSYTWDQTEEKVLVSFSVPPGVDGINAEVNDKNFMVTVKSSCGEFSKEVINGTLVDGVTSEVETSIANGRVELRLVKLEAGTRWEEFIQGDSHGTRAANGEEVEDANSRLNKFTSEKEEDAEGLGPGFNNSQLEECDDLPASSRLTRLPSETHSASHTVLLSGHQWLGNGRPQTVGLPSTLLLRRDVDALVWQPGSPVEALTRHLATFPGFGYVQASKTSKKWLVWPPAAAWVAVVDTHKHIYIYHQPQPLQTQLTNRKSGQKVKTVARQQVVGLPDNSARVLGVYPENDKLFVLLANHSIVVLQINQF